MSQSASNVAECRYGIDCHLQKCWFRHPEGRVVNKKPGVCKFGIECHRANCTFSHPEERDAALLAAATTEKPVPPTE